ncbi:protein phosphatase 2C domain-containing protein [Micromonospora sp. WMMD1082]|uniref:protein phosphatase 2C domain-containing protein n=1 Tax=Micromonospora sp. WMMD1082 TaxID=3016104 RepID=UPI0024169DC0|nr:protein phosphatase 2C domain-containing protein [Micromonospora sp. WMMD1082]MDG4795207.1 protein phosphatase 2C domain-containing protein [Micromonospora sp. WMMD1082]
MLVWTVAEQQQIPKGSGRGEDRLVLRREGSGLRLGAVIDGATDKSGRDYGGRTGGAIAAQCVADALAEHAVDLSPTDAVAMVTDRLAALRRRWAIDPDDALAPSAVAAVVVPRRGEIWRVGDVHVALRRGAGDWQVYPADKTIDRVVASARAALLHCLLAAGASAADLAATDPGRAMVMPLLRAQGVLANRDDEHPLGHGVLDGRAVPARYVEVIPVPPGVREVVLASDGYLTPAPTWAAAESELAASLRADPLRIGPNPGTKGLADSYSFDDRTYLRLTVRNRSD